MSSKLVELSELESIIESLPKTARVKTLGQVQVHENVFPLYGISLGSTDPVAPTLGFFGGVHGLERIGSKVVLAFLKTISELMRWDETLHLKLEKTRLVFFPVVNPVGMFRHTRSNGNGIDLMRNAPVEADSVNPLFLAAGHRISPKLPWYRGKEGEAMELEAQAICRLVREEISTARISLALDVHSGYGAIDRIWFPYAKTQKPFPNLPEVFALKKLLDETYPNHVYRIEPQAKQYTTHGDLWDYLYDEHRKVPTENLFLPLALEMGSWVWVKKNPRQMFSLLGAFNPLLPHRRKRTLRRHIILFDFLHRAVLSSRLWATLPPDEKHRFEKEALGLWYGEAA
jgi:Zinc carboxypeptidase